MIVDASVALKWYLVDEPHAAEAQTVLRADQPLTAPDIVIAETCNAAWRGVRVGRIDAMQATEIARSLPRVFSALVGCAALAERATAIAIELDHAVYDCFYLALVEATGLPLITADGRLLRKIRNSVWTTRVLRLSDRSSASPTRPPVGSPAA